MEPSETNPSQSYVPPLDSGGSDTPPSAPATAVAEPPVVEAPPVVEEPPLAPEPSIAPEPEPAPAAAPEPAAPAPEPEPAPEPTPEPAEPVSPSTAPAPSPYLSLNPVDNSANEVPEPEAESLETLDTLGAPGGAALPPEPESNEPLAPGEQVPVESGDLSAAPTQAEVESFSEPPGGRRRANFKRFLPFRYNKKAFAITTTVILLVAIGGGKLLVGTIDHKQAAKSVKPVAADFSVSAIPVQGLSPSGQLSVGSADQLTINGQLQVSNTLVLSPTATPTKPITGQIYYDQTSNQPYYYNGSQFVSLNPGATQHVSSIGGSSGNISLGNGLQVTGGQLALTNAEFQTLSGPLVSSLDGQSGALSLAAGPGIGVNGLTINNTGVTSLTGTANQVSVSGATGDITLSLPQDIGLSSTPSFAGLTTPNLTARVGDTALNIGSTTQDLNLEGANTTISENNNGFTSQIIFDGLSGNHTLHVPDIGGTICTTANNCANVHTYVSLQASTPGTPDVGNLNITGTAIAGSFSGNGANLTNLNGSQITSGTINSARLDNSTVTLQGNNFNGAGQLVQLNGSSQLPAVNGAQLTNLNASAISSGTVGDGFLSANVTLQGNSFNGVNELVQLDGSGNLPALSGQNLTNLDASAITSGTLADGRLSSNVALLNAANTFTGSSNTFNNLLNANGGLNTGGANINTGGGTITSGLINGQTISSSANFTGTISLATLSGTIGPTAVCWNASNELSTCSSNPGGVNLIQAYQASGTTSPQITLNSTDHGILIADASTPIGGTLFAITNNNASVSYLGVTASGVTVTGTENVSGLLTAGSFSGNGASITNINASNIATGTLNSARLDNTTVTLQGNTFNGVSELVKLDGSGALPILSGANLTSLNGTQITTGTINSSRLDNTTVTLQGNSFNGATELVQTTAGGLLPVISGANLTNLNASNISSGTLAVAEGGTGAGTAGGARTNLGAAASGANTDITSLEPTSALTVGNTGQQLTLQGNQPTLVDHEGGFTSQVNFVTPTANQVISFPDATGVVCLSTGDCLGGPAGGANTSLSNLTGVALNADLVPASDGLTSLGASTKGFANLYVADASNTYTYQLDGATTTANKTVNIPSFSGSSATICLSTNNCGSGNVSSSGGVANTLPVYTGSTALGPSIISQDAGATTVTVGGVLDVTGQLNANGGVVGDGSGLTNLNASNIASGTIGNSFLSASVTLQGNTFNSANELVKLNGSGALPTLSGANLTSLNGSQITTGTVADNRLSNNVALLNGSNTFTGTNDFASTSATAFQIQNAGGSITLLSANTTGSGALTFGVPATFNSTVAVNSLGSSGTTGVCLNGSNLLAACTAGSNPTGVTLQAAYTASVVPQIVLNSTNGGIVIQDASTPIGGNLLAIQSNGGGSTYLAVTSSGINVGGNVNASGQYQVGGVQISSANLSNDSNLAKLNANQTFTGNNTFQGTVLAGGTGSAASTTEFQVQDTSGIPVVNVDTSADILTIRGNNSTATLGSELATTTDFCNAAWTTTNWTPSPACPGPATSVTHNTGNTTPLINTQVSVVALSEYQITYTITGNPTATESVKIQIGGATLPAINGNVTNEVETVTAGNTNNLEFIPTSNWNGTISAVSVKLLTIATAPLAIQNSSGVTALEVRAPSNLNSLFIGLNAGRSITTGTSNTGIGGGALLYDTTGSFNTAVGTTALSLNTTGISNTAFGYATLQGNVSGSWNDAFGYKSLFANTIGSENSAFGQQTLQANTTGTANTALGYLTLESATTASNNTGLGYGALALATTGGNNTTLGYEAGYTSSTANATTTGTNNTFLGYQAGQGTSSYQVSNSTAIGQAATVNQSNAVILGCTNGQNGCAAATTVGIGSQYAPNALTVSPSTYKTGTIQQTTTAITGTGTTFASGMTGGTIYYNDGTTATVTFVDATHLTSSLSKTVSAGSSYTIVYGGFNVTANGTAFVQPATNSTSAFAVQNAGGTAQLTVDTNGNQVNVTTLNVSNTLSVGVLGSAGSTAVCLNGSNLLATCTAGSNPTGVTLQQAYVASTSPQIVLNSTQGGLVVQDASTPLGTNLFAVQSNGGGTNYLAVTANGASVAGTFSATSTITGTTLNGTTGINTGAGAGTQRIDASGNLVNIGNLTLSGAVSGGTTYSGSGNINTTGGALQTNSTTRVDNSGNLVNIGNITATGTYNTNTFTSSALTFGASGTATIQSGSGQALNLTGNAASTLSTTVGNLTLQAGSGTVSLGTSTALTATGALTVSSGGSGLLTLTSGSGNIVTGSTINGQTISSTANFTGTLAVTTLGASGTTALCQNGSNQLSTCTSGSNPTGVTLQQAYNASTSPDIVLSSGVGGLVVQDASSPLGTNLFAVQSNGGGTNYLAVSAAGVGVGAPVANGLLTVGTNTTTAAGGLYFGTDTDIFRSGTNNLNIGGALTVAPTNNQTVSLSVSPTINTSAANARFINAAGTFTGSGDGPAAIAAQATFSPSANITKAYGFINLATGSPGAGINIGTLDAGLNRIVTGSTGGTITTANSLLLDTPTYGTIFPGTVNGALIQNQGAAGVTTATGLNVAAQSGATTNIGVSIAASSTYSLQLAGTGGTASTGIEFGTDTDLYRSAASTLKTDSAFIAGGTSSANSATEFQVQNTAGTAALNVNTLQNITTIQAGTGNDTATLGSNLITCTDFTNTNSPCSGSQWTTTGWTAATTTATHNTGNTSALSTSEVTPVNGTVYEISYTVNGSPAASTLNVTFGGQTVANYAITGNTSTFTETKVITASSNSGNLTFTPSSAFNGIISAVSIQVLTTNPNPVLVVKNASGTANIQVRASSDTNSTFIGLSAGQSNTTGLQNTVVGAQAFQNNTTGSFNSAFGTNALQANVGGVNNTALGYGTLKANTGGGANTAVGANALNANTVGANNTALGTNALQNNTTGQNNVSVGTNTLQNNTTGVNNIAIGVNALQGSTTTNNNVAIGTNSLVTASGGSNTALGYQSGRTNVTGNATTTGSFNTFLGTNSGQGQGVYQSNNSTAIGVNAAVNQSNAVILGCTNGVNSCGAATTVGIGSQYAPNALTVSPGTYGTNGTAGTATTISQTTTAITGSGTTFTSAMTGGTIYYSDGTTATVTFVNTTSLTSSVSKTVTAGSTYTIVYGGFNVTANATAYLQPTTDSTTAFQVLNASGTSELTVSTTGGQVAVGPGAVPANGVLTVGTNTTTAAGGLYFGTDTDLYRSAANTLQTDSAVVIQPTSNPTIALNVSPTINTSAGSPSLVVISGTFTGSSAGPRGMTVNPTFTPSVSITNTYGIRTAPVANPGSGVTISNVSVISAAIQTGNGAGAVTSVNDILADTPTLGTLLPGTINGININNQGVAGVGTAIGLQVSGQSGATTDIGVKIAASTTYALQLSDTGGTANGGIEFGTDTNLFRQAAGVLQSGGALILGGAGSCTNVKLCVNSSSGTLQLLNNTGSGTTLQLQDNGVNVATVSNTGATTFENATNSTTAFQIQNSNANSLLTADTSNMQLNVGNVVSSGTIAVQGPDGGSILLGAVANSGTGANAMTFTGNEITDQMRATALQGDGIAPPDSSTGIWDATTNLMTNGGFESNTTGWIGTNGASIARDTTTAKFGSASLALTSPGAQSTESAEFAQTLTNGTTYTWSAWVKAPAGQSMKIYVDDSTFAHLGTTNFTGTGAWQYESVTVTANANQTSYLRVGRTATGSAFVFNIDGTQLEAKAFATPYVDTNGSTAARGAARVQAPAALLNSGQGWVATRMRMGFSSSTGPTAPIFWSWGDDSGHRFYLYWAQGAGAFDFGYTGDGGSTFHERQVTASFSAGQMVTLVASWSGTSPYTVVGLSVNGSTFVTTGSGASAFPTPTTAFNIGNQIPSMSSAAANTDFMWLATGTGTLSNADAVSLNSLGNSDPSITGLTAMDGSATPTFAWNGQNAAYSGTNNDQTLSSGITLDDASLYRGAANTLETNSYMLLQPTTDSTSAFQVNQSATGGGASVFDVDTSNKRVGIGTSTPNAKLDVEAAANIGLNVNQTGGNDIADFQSSGTNVVQITSTGAAIFGNTATFQDTTNSTTAFQILDQGGTSVAVADTTTDTLTVDNLHVTGTCTGCGASGTVSLQSAYTTGNTITTSSGNNINFQLASGNFVVQNAAGTNTTDNLFNLSSTSNVTDLVTNGSFEQNTTGWSAEGNMAISRVTGVGAPFGSAAMQITNSGTPVALNGAEYPMTFTNGVLYQLSFYAKTGSAFSTLSAGYSATGSIPTAGTSCTTSATLSTTDWLRVTCTFTPSGTNGSAYLYIGQNDTTARTWDVDGVMLTQVTGGAATLYQEGSLNLQSLALGNVLIQPTANTNATFMVANVLGTNGLTVNTDGSALSTSFATTISSTATINSTSTGALTVHNATTAANLIAADTSTINNSDTNGSFENSASTATGYLATKHAGSTLTVDTTANNAYEGNNTGKVVTTASAVANSGISYNLTTATMASTTTYTLSFYAKQVAGQAAFTTLTAGRAEDGATETACVLNSTTVTTAWQRYTCTFTTGTTSGTPYIYIGQTDAGVAHQYYLDGIQFTTGSSVTANYHEGNIQLNGVINSPSIFQNRSDGQGIFQVQNAEGNTALNIDTNTGNLVTNSGFENGANSWFSKGTATVSADATAGNVYQGDQSLKSVVTAASSGMQTSIFTTTIGTSTQYQLTFYAKCDSTYNTLTYGRQDVAGTDVNSTTSGNCTTNWQQYTAHWTTGGTITNPNIYVNLGSTTSGTIWIDSVSLIQTSVSAATNYNVGNISLGGVITSPTIFQNTSNSTTALQIQNAAGTTVFNVDTQNQRVGIGTNAPGNLLSIGALTTASASAQIAVSTGGTGNSGIVVQDVAGQSSGNILQAQDSSGAVLASIDYQGNLTVKAATITGVLTVNGHIVTGNTTGSTTATVNGNAGASATCSVSGNDTAGQITLATGSSAWAAGVQCTINFSSNFGSAPHPVITSANATLTAAVHPYVNSSTSNFTVNFSVPDTGSNTYIFNYFDAQ